MQWCMPHMMIINTRGVIGRREMWEMMMRDIKEISRKSLDRNSTSASSFPGWFSSPFSCLPFIKARLAIGVHAGMVLILCVGTAIHRMVDANLVGLTKRTTGAALLGTGRGPCGRILQILFWKVGLVIKHHICFLVVMLARSEANFTQLNILWALH